jgi:hypothetical protein
MCSRYLLLLVWASGLFGLSSCSKYNKLLKSPEVDVRYKGAMEYFKEKDYYHAGMLLEETLPLLKGSVRADTAQLYYAYCQFYEKQFGLAAFYFKTFYETFPRSSFAEEAAYMEYEQEIEAQKKKNHQLNQMAKEQERFDKQTNETATKYYRIKQVSSGTIFTYSNTVIFTKHKTSLEEFTLYPNPVKDKLHIGITKTVNVLSIRILSIEGILVMKKEGLNSINGELVIDVSSLSKGVYTIELIDSKGSRDWKQFVKQ